MSARLSNQVALVTGGAMGLGKAIAQRLAAEGATVIITDVDANAGSATADECGFTFIQQDVCDEERWNQVIAEIEQRFGRLNILVNNAGILGPMDRVDPENTPFAIWKKIFAVNVDSVFLGCRAAIPALRRAGKGSIVNMSSVAGLTATPYATAYGASKGTVRHLTKSVAQHLAEQKINARCNSVHPGNVLTPLWMKHAEETARLTGTTAQEVIDEAKDSTPLGEMTTPEDISAAVAFLVSEDARHVTGTEMIVDGGYINCDTYQPQKKSRKKP